MHSVCTSRGGNGGGGCIGKHDVCMLGGETAGRLRQFSEGSKSSARVTVRDSSLGGLKGLLLGGLEGLDLSLDASGSLAISFCPIPSDVALSAQSAGADRPLDGDRCESGDDDRNDNSGHPITLNMAPTTPAPVALATPIIIISRARSAAASRRMLWIISARLLIIARPSL